MGKYSRSLTHKDIHYITKSIYRINFPKKKNDFLTNWGRRIHKNQKQNIENVNILRDKNHIDECLASENLCATWQPYVIFHYKHISNISTIYYNS